MKSILTVFKKVFVLGLIIGAFYVLKCDAAVYYNTENEPVELSKLLEVYLVQEDISLEALREEFTIRHPRDYEASVTAAKCVYGRFKSIQYLVDLGDARSCEVYANVLFGIICLAYECRIENEPMRVENLSCVIRMLAGDLLNGECVPKEISERIGIKQKKFLEEMCEHIYNCDKRIHKKPQQCSIQ